MATQGSPDLQGPTAKQNSALCITGVKKIAPSFVTLVATFMYIVRLFKDLTVGRIYIYIYIVWRLRVKSCAISKVTQSRKFNCKNVRNFQHTLDLTAQLLTVQLKLKVKLYVCAATYSY